MWYLIRTVTLRHAVGNPLRGLLTAVGIALGVAAVLAVGGVNAALHAGFARMVDAVSGKMSLTVTGGPTGVTDTLLDTVRAVPGVAHASPLIERFSRTPDGRPVMVLAFDVINDRDAREVVTDKTTSDALEDPVLFLNTIEAVLVPKPLAERQGWKEGDTFTLMTARGRKSFKVFGFIEPRGPATMFGGDVLLMNVDAAQVHFERPGVYDRIDIVAAPGVPTEELRARVQRATGPTVTVERPDQRNESAEKMIAHFRRGLNAVGFLVLIVGGFLIFNTVYTTVLQRRREIGLLRCQGVTRAQVITLFVTEGVILGIAGVALGLLLGFRLAEHVLSIFTAAISSLYVVISVDRMEFPPWLVFGSAGMGVGVSLVGSLYPAWAAARLTPLETLRRNTGSGDAKDVRRFTALDAVMLASGVVVTIAGFTVPQIKDDVIGVFTSIFGVLVAVVAITPALVGRTLDAYVRAGSLGMPGTGRLAAENIRRDLRRYGMTVAAFALSIALAVDVYIFIDSMKSSVEDWLSGVIVADLYATPSAAFAQNLSTPVSEDVAGDIAAVPGVDRVVPVRMMLTPFCDSRVKIVAADFAHAPPGRNGPAEADRKYVRGNPAKARAAMYEGKAVLISDNLATRCGLRDAESITLATPRGPVDFAISGIIVSFVHDQGAIFMDRGLYKTVFADKLVGTFDIYLQDDVRGSPERIEDIRKAIIGRLGTTHDLNVLTSNQFFKEIMSAVNDLFGAVRALEAIALFIAVIGIVNTLMATVLDRTREIGVLRAVGATRVQIRTVFVTMAALMGVLGAFVGVAGGFGVSLFHVKRLAIINTGWSIDIVADPGYVVQIVITALVVSMLAGVYPAERASRLALRDALAYE